MMLRGRHRGLPNEIDRAVMLPSQANMYNRGDADGEMDEKQIISD